jgi:diguanylate cyclase (GGDEF)-like protein
MLNWLFSRPLQIKFFFSTMLLIGIVLLVLILNVLQFLNPFLSHHIEQDMQDRTHILAMAMMVGPAAHNQNELRQLLHDVSEMHGYCYLNVLDNGGKLLASAGKGVPSLAPGTESALDSDRNGCFDGSITLIHDGRPFGTLSYGVDISFVEVLKDKLRTKLLLASMLWLVVGATMYFFLVRRLVKPLQTITRASESMAHGNLNTSMPKNLPQDELGKLATSFSNMAAALRERIESQQKYAHALYAEQAQLNALVSIMPVGIMFVDPLRHVQYINLECRHLWGISDSENFTGQLDTELISHARNLLEQPYAFMQELEASLKEYGISHSFDTPLQNGRIVRSRSCVVPDASGNRYIGRIWLFEDVTEEHARLHEAQALANRDALTGLFNRRRFDEDMDRLFAQAQRNGGCLSLLYFDLDDFKQVTDEHGHVAGDKILKGIAQTLTLQARRNENLYRVSGDEFALLIAEAELHQVEALAQRVIATIEKLSFTFAEHEVHVRCSMGIAACSPESRPGTAIDLLRQADAALFQAKHLGNSHWHVYDPAHPLDLDKDSR